MSVLLRSKCVALKLSDDSVVVVLLFSISYSIRNNFKMVCFVTIALARYILAVTTHITHSGSLQTHLPVAGTEAKETIQ